MENDYLEIEKNIENGVYGEFIKRTVPNIVADKDVLDDGTIDYLNNSIDFLNKKNNLLDRKGYNQFVADLTAVLHSESKSNLEQAVYIISEARNLPNIDSYTKLLIKVKSISEFVDYYNTVLSD